MCATRASRFFNPRFRFSKFNETHCAGASHQSVLMKNNAATTPWSNTKRPADLRHLLQHKKSMKSPLQSAHLQQILSLRETSQSISTTQNETKQLLTTNTWLIQARKNVQVKPTPQHINAIHATSSTTLARYRRLIGMVAKKKVAAYLTQGIVQLKMKQNAVYMIQYAFRRNQKRRKVQLSIVIQRVWRGYLGRHRAQEIKCHMMERTQAASKIQRIMRFLSWRERWCTYLHQRYQRKVISCRKIQEHYKRYKTNALLHRYRVASATRIQRMAKHWLKMRQQARYTILHWLQRIILHRREWLTAFQACIRCQAIARRFIARSKFVKLRYAIIYLQRRHRVHKYLHYCHAENLTTIVDSHAPVVDINVGEVDDSEPNTIPSTDEPHNHPNPSTEIEPVPTKLDVIQFFDESDEPSNFIVGVGLECDDVTATEVSNPCSTCIQVTETGASKSCTSFIPLLPLHRIIPFETYEKAWSTPDQLCTLDIQSCESNEPENEYECKEKCLNPSNIIDKQPSTIIRSPSIHYLEANDVHQITTTSQKTLSADPLAQFILTKCRPRMQRRIWAAIRIQTSIRQWRARCYTKRCREESTIELEDWMKKTTESMFKSIDNSVEAYESPRIYNEPWMKLFPIKHAPPDCHVTKPDYLWAWDPLTDCWASKLN